MRSDTEISDPEALLQFAHSKRLLQFASSQTLADTTAVLHKIVVLADKNMPIKAYLDLTRDIQHAQGKPRCFEDEFMLATSFLDLEVSKLGAITYLKGESTDYKETKRNRILLDTRDESVLKNLSAGLARPNEERGNVEMDMIESSYKRIAKLIDLHKAVPEVVRMHQEGATKHDVLGKVRVGLLKERMTLTDYDIIMRMARRENKIAVRNRKKDPANNYELRLDNHEMVMEFAQRIGTTPRRALNRILDDFRDLTKRHRQLGALKAAGAGKDADNKDDKA